MFPIVKIVAVVGVVAVMTFVVCSPVEEKKTDVEKTTVKPVYCQPQTPCGWKIQRYVDYPDVNLTNDFCVCEPGQVCQVYEIKSSEMGSEAYVEYRCRKEDEIESD